MGQLGQFDHPHGARHRRGHPRGGIFSDGANAAIYAAEGDYVNAAISGASAAANLVPGGGIAAKAGKIAIEGALKGGERLGIKQAEKMLAERVAKETLEKEAAEAAAKKAAEEAAAKKAAEKRASAETESGGGGSKKKDTEVKNKGEKPKCGGRATYSRQGTGFLEHEMERDHIPNVASLQRKAMELLDERGVTLQPDQLDALLGKKDKKGQRQGGRIYEHAQTIAVPKEVHRASPTTGNRDNYKDKDDLSAAAKRDTKNHRDKIAKSDNNKDCLEALEEASEVIDGISNEQYEDFLNGLIDSVKDGKKITDPWKGIIP